VPVANALPSSYRALLVDEPSPGLFRRRVIERPLSDLPDHEVLVRVHYSSLNYKDALSANGNRGVTRRYPHTPGIDAAGVVAASRTPEFAPGDEVLVSCYDLGMNTPGGFGQYIRVPAAWVMPKPKGLGLREAMIYGTAGFTAAQCLARLVDFPVPPTAGKILVTGASGGVGSIAVALLARLGYEVAAVTGKPEQADFLRELGAQRILSREEALDTSERAAQGPLGRSARHCGRPAPGHRHQIVPLQRSGYLLRQCRLARSAFECLSLHPQGRNPDRNRQRRVSDGPAPGYLDPAGRPLAATRPGTAGHRNFP